MLVDVKDKFIGLSFLKNPDVGTIGKKIKLENN